MRNNQPVTEVEHAFTEGEVLVSKTDLAGIITYANRAFCKIAGFTEAELIGQPHNIVRHPDMPEAAFVQMWQDIQSGTEWKGAVKNRCKDGGYYWVYATVMAEFNEQGEITGYISVRRALSTVAMTSEDAAATLT